MHSLVASFTHLPSSSLSAQVILRGTRSAGYGFVALATAEAAQKAVEALDKKELDGRQVIVEVAKPSDQKDKEKKEKKSKRRTSRRGSKAVPGEVSEAEANGEAAHKADDAAATNETDGVVKPKKKKKAAVRFFFLKVALVCHKVDLGLFSVNPRRRSRVKFQMLTLRPLMKVKLPLRHRRRCPALARPGHRALFGLLVKIPLASPPKPCSLSPTSVSPSMMLPLLPFSPMQASMSFPLASFKGAGANPEGARATVLWTLVARQSSKRPLRRWRAKRSAAAPLPSKSLSMPLTMTTPPESRMVLRPLPLLHDPHLFLKNNALMNHHHVPLPHAIVTLPLSFHSELRCLIDLDQFLMFSLSPV